MTLQVVFPGMAVVTDTPPVIENVKHYDEKSGILKSLSSLKTFKELLKERQIAGYERKEHLNSFVVKGHWLLDTCGNCMKITTKLPKLPELVMSSAEINKIFDDCWTASSNCNIPPENVKCPICKQRFTIQTAVSCRTENLNLNIFNGLVFSGKTLKQIRDHLNTLIDALYIIPSECNIQNDRFIDLTPNKHFPDSPKNRHGWVNQGDDYVVQEDDKISYWKWMYYHPKCQTKKENQKAQKLIDTDGEGYNTFYNLAGNEYCDAYIKAELKICGINVCKEKCKGEVPAHYKGKLNGFTFKRAWHYWIVDGDVPLEIADKMYKTKEGAKSVRVVGHCGCPPPKRWARENKKGELVIDTYHIDTLPGLKLFAKEIKAI